jgi:hypothetical protein
VRASDSAIGKDRVPELERRHSYLKKNATVDVIVFALTIVVPVIGLYITPLLGTILGISAGIVNYFLTPHAKLRVLEIFHERYVEATDT